MKNVEENIKMIYIYELIDPRTNLPFYVGYTDNLKRRFNEHLNINSKHKQHNSYKINIIKKIIKLDLKPRMEIVDSCEEIYHKIYDMFKHEFLEIFYIKKYKDLGIKLTNLTNGGGHSPRLNSYKKVYQYSEDGVFLKEYNSNKEFAYLFNTSQSLISKVVDQKNKNSYKQTYLFSSKEKASNFKFKKTKKLNVPILQYTLEGNYVNTFKNQYEAAIVLNIKQGNINKCLKNLRKHTGGFYWFYENNIPSNIVKYEKQIHRLKCVVQYTKENIFVKKYKSIKCAAIETNISSSCISINVRGITKTAGGYIWKYENEIPETIIYKHNKKSRKSVLKFDLDNKLLEEYCSLSEAEIINLLPSGHISKILHGRIKNNGNYNWKYKNE